MPTYRTEVLEYGHRSVYYTYTADKPMETPNDVPKGAEVEEDEWEFAWDAEVWDTEELDA